MDDLLFMTLTLMGAVGVCFARPCTPEHWAHVKAARAETAPAPKSARGSRSRSDTDLLDELAGTGFSHA